MIAAWRAGGAAALLCLALAGCATDPARLSLGISRETVLQQSGTPTATYPMPGGGERLQYSRAPAGFTVTNVDLDAGGRVVSVRQELQDGMFDVTVQPFVWRADDILRTYGRPFEISRVLAYDGQIWAWHYMSNNTPRLFYIYVSPDGLVERFHTADDLRLDLVGR
ncbi:MAG TPA: hypothetical protein VGI11_16895 [Variovorax sp.]